MSLKTVRKQVYLFPYLRIICFSFLGLAKRLFKRLFFFFWGGGSLYSNTAMNINKLLKVVFNIVQLQDSSRLLSHKKNIPNLKGGLGHCNPLLGQVMMTPTYSYFCKGASNYSTFTKSIQFTKYFGNYFIRLLILLGVQKILVVGKAQKLNIN